MRPRIACLLLVAGLLLTPHPLWAISEADRLWLVGEQAFGDRLYALSRRMLERFLVQYPQDSRSPQATLLLAKSQLALGALERALAGCRGAQRFAPPPGSPQEARFWEGETLFKLRRYAEARAAYQALLDEDAAAPHAPDALYGVAWSELELGRREPAAAAFRKLLEVWPGHATASPARFYLGRTLTELRQYDEAAAVLALFVNRDPPPSLLPDATYLRGFSLVSAGKTAEGVRELKAFVTASPRHELVPQARRVVVDALLRDGSKAELAAEYDALLKQSPPTVEGLYDAGVIAQKLGKEKDAEVAWRGLRSKFPDHALTARASLELADIALKRNQFKESLAHALKASESEELAVKLGALLLMGESELKQKHPQAALKAFQSAEALEAGDPARHFRAVAGRGLAHEELRQWAAAAKAYEAVAEESPDKTLRQWAKERLAAVRARLTPPSKARPEKPKS
jgi:TolA-binding protein